MKGPLAAGTLVVVEKGELHRIARVVEDYGHTVLIETDSRIEGQLAVDDDLETPAPMSMEVKRSYVRVISEPPGVWP